MKKSILIIALGLIACQAFGQTAMYNRYKSHAGLQASVIKNYDIEKNTKVTVTMLEAADTATYNTLKRELKALKPSTMRHSAIGLGKIRNLNMNVTTVAPSADSASTESSAATVFGKIRSLNMDVTPADPSANSAVPYHVDIQDAAPLPGDKGEYLICGSSKTLSILVFHCPDADTYRKVMRFVLLNAVK